MNAQWLSALAVVALVFAFLWRSGASIGLTLIVAALAGAAIACTALLWEILINGDS